MDDIKAFLANLGAGFTEAQQKRKLPDPPACLASNLKIARRRHGLTQEQLAAKCDVSQHSLSVAERGGPMSEKHLAAVARALGLTVTELCREDVCSAA